MAVLSLQGGLLFLGVSNLPCASDTVILGDVMLGMKASVISCDLIFKALEISGICYICGLFCGISSFLSL